MKHVVVSIALLDRLLIKIITIWIHWLVNTLNVWMCLLAWEAGSAHLFIQNVSSMML